MKKLFVVIFLLIVALPSFVQSSERRETIVIPVATLGNISESRKQIIQNTLNQELSKYFRLVPQDKFEEAQEKAFEELDYEECTEDQCIILIQEFLQVENVFSLQLVEEDGDTQLSLTWVGLDEKKVQTDFCEGCKTKELNKKISKLVLTIFNKLEVTEKKGIQPPEKNEQIVNEKEIPVKNDIKINPNNSNIRFDGLIVFDRTKIEGFDNEKIDVLSFHYIFSSNIGLGYNYSKIKNKSQDIEIQLSFLDVSYNFENIFKMSSDNYISFLIGYSIPMGGNFEYGGLPTTPKTSNDLFFHLSFDIINNYHVYINTRQHSVEHPVYSDNTEYIIGYSAFGIGYQF